MATETAPPVEETAGCVRPEIADPCRKIRPPAVDLVDALVVPHEKLLAPDLVGPA